MANTKQNNPGLGIEYEVHVPAYFALLLNTNPEIVDFKLQSNVQDFGNFDDLLVDVTTKSGGHLYFAFQLKHKEKSSKNLLPTNFEAKGDFNLEKYCQAFKNLREENRKRYHFILYTNKNFDSSRTSQVKHFCMIATQDVYCFDTSGNGNNLYKFEVKEETEEGKIVKKKDYEDFFLKFSLYTGQANASDLENSILNKLKSTKCYATYIDFFRKWHKGDFTNKPLDKKTLNVHLVDIFLSSSVINYYISNGQDEDSIFFEDMVQKFDITIFDASKQDFIKHLEKNVHKYPEEFNNQEVIIRLAKDHKFIGRVTKELNEETKLKLLHYFYHKPIILDESSKDLIYEASKLCKLQEAGIQLVIIGEDIDVSKFSHLKIFTNLTDVDENFLEETKKRCKLSLQGRNILFGEIFEDEIRQFVTPREIFQMVKGNFLIGEDKEKLPECYIPRTVSAKVFDIESIIQHSSGSTAIIFYYEDKFEELKTLIHNIVDRESYFYEDFLDGILLRKKESSKKHLHQDNPRDTFPAIILTKEKCSRKQFDEICEELRKKEHSEKELLKKESIKNEIYSNERLEIKEKVIHLFQVVNENRCLLLMSTKNIFYNQKHKSTKMSLKEKNIHTFFNKTTNILCTQPGMGKSTLIKYLKNECDSNFWTVMVDLKAHNQFFKRNHKIVDVLNYFLENCHDIFLSKIKKMFLEKRKIVFFLDGLDEVEDVCVGNVLDIARQLSEMGFRIWLSSRQNLQQKIENYFNIFAIEIDEINENQQKKYIEDRLRSQYNENEIQEIVKKIFSNTDLASNRRILEIPLQLHIITRIFLDERSYYYNLIKNNFILTKMLEIFFEGRCKHNLTKTEVKYTHILRPVLEEILKKYETVAMHSVLDDEHFKMLKIENFEPIQNKDWDLLGIIVEINKENKAVFEHLTFAEYFAAKFLVKNFDKARILREEIFSEKYQNLRIIFNIMLAENSPLHLAVIYRDFDRIEKNEASLVDKGGRNFLQVAACIATRHPPLESDPEPITSECLTFKVKDVPVWHFKGEDTKIKEIVNRLLSSETFKNDKIFEWNSLDYALVNGALYIVEAILEKFEKPFKFYEMLATYYSDEVIAYYSIRFGYPHLLSEILAKESCHVTRIHTSNYQRGIYSTSIINYLFTSDCKNRTSIVELLTGDDINKIVDEKNGYNFFHFAVLHQDIEFIKFLFEKRADVNIQNKDGRSLLFLAAEKSHFEISKLLVENGADVNTKSNGGLSPLLPAVYRNNLEISKFLVANGADVNFQGKNGRSPLTWAVKLNNLEILKLLVENGADVNIKVKFEEPPLVVAINNNNFEISKLLVENGTDVNIKNKFFRESPLLLAVNKSNFEISKLLVENGADVNTKSKRGWTPLLRAADLNNLEISKLLVENGADVNTKCNNGWRPLFFAAGENNLEMSKLLIEKGADVNVKNKGEWSPLSLAVNRNNLEMSKLLIEKGADVNVKNKGEWSPLSLAVNRNNLEMSKLLIEKGADVNDKNIGGWSPLLYAAVQNNLAMSKLLIEKGADVNIKDKDGRSPLYWTAKLNNLEMSKLLIGKGADVNAKDEDGRSPLYWTAKRNNLEMAKLLIEKGADVNVKNKNGKSPLFCAVKLNKNSEMSKLLFERGAEVNSEIRDAFHSLCPESNIL